MKNQRINRLFLYISLFLLVFVSNSAFVSIGSESEKQTLLLSTQRLTSGNTYYVSVSGDDNHSGTFNQPWRTLRHASSQLQAGDTLLIRGGTYQEVTSWETDGRSDAPITIKNYPGEKVVIDGYDQIPAHQGGIWMFMIWGDWYHVSGLEVKRSFDEGAIGVKGANVTIEDCFVHHNWAAGITMMGDNGLALKNRVWYNGISNEFLSRTRDSWPAALTCARYPSNCTLKGNVSWENWGEGISTFEALYTKIEDNISFNNQQNLYISDTQNTVVQRNFIYCTAGNIIDPYVTQNGILVGDEKMNPASSDNRIINNIVSGCDRNLAIGTSESTNNMIANNTFVNADGDTNILFYAGSCSNCLFLNNLIVQENALEIAVNEGRGWEFSNNLWSKSPPAAVRGIYDLIGAPGLVMTGHPTSVDWYQLASNSLAIDTGKALNEIIQDYSGYARIGGNDIGAHEFVGAADLPRNFEGDYPGTYSLSTPSNPKGSVDIVNFRRISIYWMKTGPPGWIPEDFNLDGQVNVLDLVLIGARWLKAW